MEFKKFLQGQATNKVFEKIITALLDPQNLFHVRRKEIEENKR